MKRYKKLFARLCSFDNLLKAASKAAKGKRFNSEVIRFNDRLEKQLLYLSQALLSHTYQPGAYVPFWAYDKGKKRYISRAPFRDRVVHHALMNVIDPIFEPTLIYDCYANRKHKGTHKGIDRAQAFAVNTRYVLKCDISKYFASIDHQFLKCIVRKKIADPEVLWLIDTIIDASNAQEPVHEYFPGDDLFTPLTRRKGIPIGNLTSQFFANIYLNGFDHFVKQISGARCYLRYVDDFLCFDDDKGRLLAIKQQMSEYLETLRLILHPKKTKIFPTRLGVPFLGYVVYPHHRKLSKKNSMAFRKRLRAYRNSYRNGDKEFDDVTSSVRSWVAHASHANTYKLRESIFSKVMFSKDRRKTY